jgi:hypothetical protein
VQGAGDTTAMLASLGENRDRKIRWLRRIGTLTMTNESSSPAEHYVACEECAEQNKRGSVRCARCGAELLKVVGAAIDPQLRDFDAAQAELAEKLQRERRKTVMIDILQSGGSEFKPR